MRVLLFFLFAAFLSTSAGAQEKAVSDFEKGRRFWSFQPVRDVAPPKVKQAEWISTPIDAFILAKLEEKGISPVTPADKRTLIRRATFDLIGLPPTPEEIDAFLADDSADAFARGVDRLLASPHYGERWGRHWLDLVRYADTAGDNSDYPTPQAYRYRNYVIQSFNQDKPYDQFLREQVAGDLLPSRTEEERYGRLIATGYIAISRRFGSQIKGYPQHLTIEDTIDNLGRTMLGLTVGCARCHDHKFDPISTEDYYALYGIFNSTHYPFPGIELERAPRDLVPLLSEKETETILKPYLDRLATLGAETKKLEREMEAQNKIIADLDEAKKFIESMKAPEFPKAKPPAFIESDPELKKKLEDLETARAGASRTWTTLKEAVERHESRAAAARARLPELKAAAEGARKKREELAGEPPDIPWAYAVAEGKKRENARVQVHGDPRNLRTEVPRRFLQVLGGQELPKEEKGSGRLQLAEWLTDPANPLTARVMVNRIWRHHFGRGIVETPSDFGVRGQAPTHPELLDFLARRFAESGWSIKAMHRLVMLSQTYRLSSRDDAEAVKADPSNALHWKFDRRRLEAEAIRDAILAVSGGLNVTMGMEHPFPPPKTWAFSQHKPFTAVYETSRRSVYLMTQRFKKHPFLAVFDGADTNADAPQRGVTTTPIQALFLMNDAFVHEQAGKFASRLLGERSDEPARLSRAHLLAFGRAPAEDEKKAAGEFLAQVREKLKAGGVPDEEQPLKAWSSYARALMGASEFIYVD